ncbi:hypothetical protein COLO4_30156 [Corchorus olitorius]|uniref:Poor homologous synapsis 1 PH domain-containing protein n=1 Tax=Corchorus olitorius TaxID=93759 RepID=A0A1R3HAT5_9ROSI|nr:hypothetical protein COLO4_30156 [Corchorus olitorius]
MKEQWEIHYSRFFNFPDIKSTGLTPLPPKNLRSIGNWVSSLSSASLQLITNPNSHGTVLVVSSLGKIYEEHYASRLHLTWPQVSCLECPVRGSRVILASYKDCSGQVQKFAMRFSTSYDSQTFMNSLKESFKDAGNSWLPSSNCALPTSLPLELVDFNGINARTDAEFCHENHSGNHEPLLLPPSNDEGLIHQCTKEPVSTHHLEAKYAEVPSSFSALLSQGADAVELPNAPTAMNNISGMVSGMTYSSFQDMLSEMEMFIDDLGGVWHYDSI